TLTPCNGPCGSVMANTLCCLPPIIPSARSRPITTFAAERLLLRARPVLLPGGLTVGEADYGRHRRRWNDHRGGVATDRRAGRLAWRRSRCRSVLAAHSDCCRSRSP